MFFLKKEKKRHAAIKRFMEATMKIDFDFKKFYNLIESFGN